MKKLPYRFIVRTKSNEFLSNNTIEVYAYDFEFTDGYVTFFEYDGCISKTGDAFWGFSRIGGRGPSFKMIPNVVSVDRED